MTKFNLIMNSNQELRMSSKQISELADKRHDNVMRDIKGMIVILEGTVVKPGDLKIEESYYIDSQGKKQPMYLLGKRETLCLVTGYSVELRMVIIDRWQELEEQNQQQQHPGRVLPKTWSETLEMLAHEVRENEQLQVQLKEAQPKIAFTNSVEASQDTILVTHLAVILKQSGLDIGEKRLFKWLRDNNYLCKDKSRWNKPTQKAMELELFKCEEMSINKSNGIVILRFTPKVTGKGQVYFVNKLLSTYATATDKDDNDIHIIKGEAQC